MNDSSPKYHPSVEKNFETSGQNVGRVKDGDLARDLADIQEKELIIDSDEMAKYKIAQDAILDSEFTTKMTREIADKVTGNAFVNEDGTKQVLEDSQWQAESTARIALDDYDKLKKASNEEKQRREDEARKNILSGEAK